MTRRTRGSEALPPMILAIASLIGFAIGDSPDSVAGGQTNEVYVGFGTSYHYGVQGDSFANSQVTGSKNWFTRLQRREAGGVPVRDVRLRLHSTLTLDQIKPSPNATGPPTYDWYFGDVPDESGMTVNVGPGPSVPFTPGFDASRSADKTTFTAPGNQTLTIVITPRAQMDALSIDVAICRDECAAAIIVFPATDETRGIMVSDDGQKLNIHLQSPVPGTNYTFTMITEVTPRVPEVEFMPKVDICWTEPVASGTASGSSASHSMPDLGAWIWSASGTYDWRWGDSLGRSVGFDGYCSWPRDTTPPAIRDLSCTTDAPFGVSARITDNVALQSVTLAILSADDYRIVQQLAGPASLGNGTDIDLAWDGSVWALTDGILAEDTSLFVVSAEQNIVALMCIFDRDGEGGENETTAFAWFDPATLRLVNLSTAGLPMTPLSVIPGVSTITAIDLYVSEELMESFLECIPPDAQGPGAVRFEKKQISFVPTTQNGEFNIRLAKKAAPPGDYLLLLVAGDTSMNQAWCFANHTLALQGLAQGEGMMIWGVDPSPQAWLGRYVYHENISQGDLQFSGSALINAFLPFSPPHERGWLANGTVAFEAKANATWTHAGTTREVALTLSSGVDACLFYLPQYDHCVVANLTFEGTYRNGTVIHDIRGRGFFVATYGPEYRAISPESGEGLGLILQIEAPFVAGLHLGWAWENTSTYFPDAPGGRILAPAAEHVAFNLSTDVGVTVPSMLVADFSASPRSGVEPLTVVFVDLSESDQGITSWSWSFGDGSTSALRNPSHRYEQEGTYTVSLTVREADGDSDVETKAGYITVSDVGPIARFSANPGSGVEPLTVNFTDASTSHDGIVSWFWDFGDGSTSRQASPRHLYVQDGAYQVALTVMENDADTSAASGIIVVGDAEPDANLSATPTEGAEPLKVLFIDGSRSHDGIVLWSWEFGDGSTSTERNPTHIYSAKGTYDVSLTVWESDGDWDVETRPGCVAVPEALLGPFVIFLSLLPWLFTRRWRKGKGTGSTQNWAGTERLLPFLMLFAILLAPTAWADTIIGSRSASTYASADATVNLTNPDANYGDQTLLEVHIDSYLSYAYMMFDLSVIPPDANILSAQLKAYLSSFSGYVSTLGVHHCPDTSWTETGITWNNKPGFAAEPTSTIAFKFGLIMSGYRSWDVTPDVRTALAVGRLTEVLVFERSDLSTHVRFRSKEASQSHPYLQVSYVTAPVHDVHLQSVPDTGGTSDLGSISITAPVDSGSVTYPLTLPQDAQVMEGSYNVTYNAGYSFIRWETTGGLSVADPQAQSTTLTVAGPGTLKAIGSTAQIQYFYDDGSYDGRVGSSKKPGEMVAVRFTPLISDKLLSARFYFAYAYNHTIKVHVMDVTRTDLIPPFDQTVFFAKGYTTRGWFDVDLSGYGLMLNAGMDYYIGMEWTREGNPELGCDWASPIDNRSWSRNATGWQAVTGTDYMIRAIMGAKTASSLSCSVNPASMIIGSSVTVSGSLVPVHAGAKITLTHTRSNGTVVLRAVTTDANGIYSDAYKPDAAGSWSVAASWGGDGDHEGAQSSIRTYAVAKASSTISCSSFQTSVTIGSSVTVSGYISPIHGGAAVALTYIRPDGGIVARTVTATASGYYSDAYKPDGVGSWTVRASWLGDHDHEGATSSALQLAINKASSSISCRASATGVPIGLSTLVSGLISPAHAAFSVVIQLSTDGGSTWNDLAFAVTDSDGSYSYNWTPAAAGSYLVRSHWVGDEDHLDATSSSRSVTVFKGSSTISCNIDPASIAVGSSTTISGSVSPGQAAWVTLHYSKDGGASWIDMTTLTSKSDGSYSHIWTPADIGSYRIKASWPGDSNRNGAESPGRTLSVAPIVGEGLCVMAAAAVVLIGLAHPSRTHRHICPGT